MKASFGQEQKKAKVKAECEAQVQLFLHLSLIIDGVTVLAVRAHVQRQDESTRFRALVSLQRHADRER